MQKNNFSLRGLTISKWPIIFSGGLYCLCIVVLLTLNISILLKILSIGGASLYYLWWQRQILVCRFTELSVITLDNSWILSGEDNQSVEAVLQAASLYSWGVILNLELKTNEHCSLLITAGTVNSTTFRQLRVYLRHSLTG